MCIFLLIVCVGIGVFCYPATAPGWDFPGRAVVMLAQVGFGYWLIRSASWFESFTLAVLSFAVIAKLVGVLSAESDPFSFVQLSASIVALLGLLRYRNLRRRLPDEEMVRPDE